jgi:very-short-patch-repair endonuclease
MSRYKSYNEVKTYVEDQGEKLVSTEYIRSKEKLEIECSACHCVYKMNWKEYYNGSRCNICFINRKKNPPNKKKYEDVKKYIEDHGDILISTEYISCFTKLEIECGTCKNIFMMHFRAYKGQNHRCKLCGNKKMGNRIGLSQEHVEEYIKNNGDELISKYHNCVTKLQIICGICKSIYNMSFTNYYSRNCRCPCIKKPKGEKLIEDYLKNRNIEFEIQKILPDCKYIKTLYFDFYLPDYNLLIEFDGMQHMKPIKHFGGNKTFENIQKRDTIKNVYCIKNKYYLLRIPHTDIKNIDTILDNYLENEITKNVAYSSILPYMDLIIKTCEQLMSEKSKPPC